MKLFQYIILIISLFCFKPFNAQIKKDNTRVTWKLIGDETFPANDSIWYRSNEICGIGQVTSLYIDEKDANHLLIGATSGGVWESSNALNSNPKAVKWQCLTNDIPASTIGRILVHKDMIYASSSSVTSGSYFSSKFKNYGLGVIKKVLNSDHWEISDFRFECNYFDLVEKDGQIIIYAISNRKVYKSINAGQDWKELSSLNDKLSNPRTLLQRIMIQPDNPDVVYIFTRNSEEILYKTTDGGITWEDQSTIFHNLINTKIGTTQISTKAFYDKNDAILYIALHNRTDVFIIYSKDWNNFSLYNENRQKGIRTTSMRRTAFIKHDSSFFYGATYLHKITNHKTSKSISGRKIHVDIRDLKMIYDKQNNTNILYIATDGGIFMSKDLGETYTNISGNLQLFQTFNMSINNYNNHRYITIGTQDDGWYQIDRDGDNKWHLAPICCEGSVYTQPTNPNVVYFNNKGTLTRSDKGIEYPLRTKFVDKIIDFDAPIAFHPDGNQTIVYAKYIWPNSLLKISNNKGIDKRSVSLENSIKIKGRPTAMSFCRNNPAYFYMSSIYYTPKTEPNWKLENHLYKTSNMNDSSAKVIFTDLIENLRKLDKDVLDQDMINDIEVHDDFPDKVWICFGNIKDGKKIYFSENGGLKWSNISYNLSNVPVNRIKYDTTHKLLFIGTDYGVYYLRNKLWTRYGEGLPTTIVTALEIDKKNEEILVSTHGRSVWSATTAIKKFKDILIKKNTTWTTNHIINGDLIIKNGAKLTIKNARIEVSNIIIENHSSLICENTRLVSSLQSDTNHSEFLNTTIQAKKNTSIDFNRVTLNNFDIDLDSSTKISYSNNKLINSKVYFDINSVLSFPLKSLTWKVFF